MFLLSLSELQGRRKWCGEGKKKEGEREAGLGKIENGERERERGGERNRERVG